MASTVELRAILRDEISAGLKGIRAELEKVNATGKGAGDGISSGMSQALPTVRGVTDALGLQVAQLRAQRDAMKTEEYSGYAKQQREISAEIKRMNKANDDGAISWGAIAGKAFLAYQAFGMVSGAISSVVSAAADYDSLNTRLKATEGSAMLAADAMAKLYEIAKQPGIGMEEAANAYAGLRALKVTGAEAMKVIDGIAKANAAMGGGAEQFGRAMYQIRQAYGKHKLTGEDLKDLSESIPNIAGVIQTAFKGASLEAINAKYSINEVMQKIAEAAKDLPPQGDTIKNNFDNIADSWKHLKAQMADSSVIKAATGALASLLDAMDQRGQKTESRLERLNRMEASKKWSIGLDADSRTSQQHLRDMTKEEREWVETGKYSEKVALAVADAKAKQAAASKQAAEASKAERQSTLTKLQEDVGKTDRVEKIKAENEWYDSQRKILERTKDAAVDAKAELALLDKAHAEHLKKIEKGEPKPKKERHAERDTADKEAAEMVKRWADVDKWNADQQVKAKKIREEEFQLELKDMQKKDAAQRRLNEAAQRREERDMEVHRKMQEFLWEQEREMEEHNAKMAEGAWMSAASTMQGTFSTAFMEIGKKHGEFMLTLTEGFEGALNKMASDLAANAAIFGILSLIGGPAATFAEGAGGLTGALFGMRATGGSVGGGAYLVGENRPEVFRPTVPGQIHNSTSHTSYGGVTINVHGGGADPKAIAAAVVRAQKIQALGHKATSR